MSIQKYPDAAMDVDMSFYGGVSRQMIDGALQQTRAQQKTAVHTIQSGEHCSMTPACEIQEAEDRESQMLLEEMVDICDLFFPRAEKRSPGSPPLEGRQFKRRRSKSPVCSAGIRAQRTTKQSSPKLSNPEKHQILRANNAFSFVNRSPLFDSKSMSDPAEALADQQTNLAIPIASGIPGADIQSRKGSSAASTSYPNESVANPERPIQEEISAVAIQGRAAAPLRAPRSIPKRHRGVRQPESLPTQTRQEVADDLLALAQTLGVAKVNREAGEPLNFISQEKRQPKHITVSEGQVGVEVSSHGQRENRVTQQDSSSSADKSTPR